VLSKIHRIIKGSIILACLFSSVAMGDSRGYRNNNPGNLIQTEIQWRGEVQCSDRKFECFGKMSDGVRAIVLVLNSYYQREGLRNINEIFTRYVGTEDRNKHAYIRYALGRSPVLCDRSYIEVIELLVTTIVTFENGYLKDGLSIKEIVNETLPHRVDDKWRC